MGQAFKHIAVIGTGVMGSGIAALIANAGIRVSLLDIVPKDAENRNQLAEGAIERQLQAKPSGFTHKNNAKRITAGNLEDDDALLADADWIIEVVLEDIEVKRKLYSKLEQVRKAGSIVSSNTSTLPLHTLVDGRSMAFKQDFAITHFFNPPRFMRLLELTGGSDTKPEHLQRLRSFTDEMLGKGVVACKDTPGFLANRIGIFWLMVGLYEALDLNIKVEEADAIMGRPLGMPKTGVFGLFDLIGIDLMPLIAKAMLDTLPEGDRFRAIYHQPELITTLIKDGYTGRKGKGGFTRIRKDGEKKIKETLELSSGEYRAPVKPALASIEAAKSGVYALLSHDDIGGQYAKRVLVQVMHYAASLVPEISDDIYSIDQAMKLGYNWKYGVFELIDKLATKEQSGAEVLALWCEEAELTVPPLLRTAKGKPFYREQESALEQLLPSGEYAQLEHAHGAYMLRDNTRGRKPIASNGSARIWEMEEDVLCVELTSKMNAIDTDILSLLEEACDMVERKHMRGLVIGGDADQFSVGANLAFFTMLANMADWKTLEQVITHGQRAFMRLKYAPFPVVAAPSGMALGGGCEMLLHCDAIAAHMETYPGLVEVGVGVIPGWGGCKEMLLRYGKTNAAGECEPGVAGISKAFEQIMLAKVAGSAQEAKELHILNENSRIIMNRARVLSAAHTLVLQLADGYTTPEPATLRLPGATARAALMMGVDNFRAQGKTTPHDEVIAKHLASVLSGGDTDITDVMSEQDILDLECKHFLQLVRTPQTVARIEHMLSTNKPLRN